MKAGRLMIGWHRQWHNPSQAEEAADWLQNEPQIYFEDSDTSWNGQFRKVKITVIVYSDLNYGDVSAKPVEVAEALTKRLVGFNGAVSWEKIPLATLTESMASRSGWAFVNRLVGLLETVEY
jgi:hypothetical protein